MNVGLDTDRGTIVLTINNNGLVTTVSLDPVKAKLVAEQLTISADVILAHLENYPAECK